jgi:hypothetical protein
LARRSIVLTIVIAIFVAACAASRPSAAPTSTPALALVTAPPTVAPTPTPSPTEAPPTKKPKKTKRPKPTPTPEVWSEGYRSHVCAAIGYLSDTKAHVDGAATQLAGSHAPQARAEAFEVIALTVKASDSIGAAKAWPPGDELEGKIGDSIKTLGNGATHFLAGLAALDFDVMHAASAEMDGGGEQLGQAEVILAGLSATYGPAGC